MKEKFPDKPFVIAGDNDHHLVNHPNIRRNIGAEEAQKVAEAVSGIAVCPNFPKEQLDKSEGKSLTDFNDLARTHPHGKDGVKRQITNAIEKQKAHAARQQFQERPREKAQETSVTR